MHRFLGWVFALITISVVIVGASRPTTADASLAASLASHEESETDPELETYEALDTAVVSSAFEFPCIARATPSGSEIGHVGRIHGCAFVPFEDRSAAGKPPPSRTDA